MSAPTSLRDEAEKAYVAWCGDPTSGSSEFDAFLAGLRLGLTKAAEECGNLEFMEEPAKCVDCGREIDKGGYKADGSNAAARAVRRLLAELPTE